MTKEQIKQTTISSLEMKRVSQSKLMKLLEQIKELEQWLGKMSGFFSISIKNIQNFSTDNLAFCQQFKSQTKTNQDFSSLKQFQSLTNSFGLQLSYFENSSKFIQTQFQHTYQQAVKKFKSCSLDFEISQKMKNSNMQHSIIEVVKILQKFYSNSFSQKIIQNKQNIALDSNTLKIQQFLIFFQKLNKSLNSSTSPLNTQQHLTQLLSSLNLQIISYSKKLHSIITSLFKNLLQQISNRFLQFKTPNLFLILNTNSVYVFDFFELNLDQYQELIKNNDKQECLWFKSYLNNIRKKLQRRNQFCQKYHKLLGQYFLIFQSIVCQKYKNGHKQSLKLLGKHPLLINDKTRIIIESIETTTCSIIGLIEKLANQLLMNTKEMKQIKEKINIFTKKVLNRIQEIQNTKDQRCGKMIDLINNVNKQEKQLLKQFQETVQKYIQSIFISFSQIQSKLLVINQTYFGLALRDTTKHIKLWSISFSKELTQVYQNNKLEQNITKTNEILFKIRNKLINFEKNRSAVINNSTLLLENPVISFYCIYNNTIGQLQIFTNRIKFSSLLSISITFTMNSQQILKILFSNNLLQIHGSKTQKLNLFNKTSYASYLLRSLFLKIQSKISSNKSLECSLQNESQQEEQQEKLLQYFVLSKEIEKQRQLKLLGMLNNKFQSLSSVIIQNTDCIHLLNILFGQKDYSCDNKKFKQFYLYFKQKQGELNLKHDNWDNNPINYITDNNIKNDCPMIFKRKFRFDHPIASMGIPFIPKTCNSVQLQSLVLASKDKFFIQSQVQSTGAPYTDCFVLKARSIFSNIDNSKVKLDFVIEMQWLKRTMMKSMVQKQGYGQTRTANQAFIKLLKSAVNTFPIIKQPQIISIPKIKKPKQPKPFKTFSPNFNEQKQKQTFFKNQQNKQYIQPIQTLLAGNKMNNSNSQNQQKQLILIFENLNEKHEVYSMTQRFFLFFLVSLLWQFISC